LRVYGSCLVKARKFGIVFEEKYTFIIVMAQLLVNTNKIQLVGGQLIAVHLFHYGVNHTVNIYFKDQPNLHELLPDSFICIGGDFIKETKPYKIYFQQATIIPIPYKTYWENFLVSYLVASNVPILIEEYPQGFLLSSCLEDYYIRCDISKDKTTAKKIEFGRFMPIEKPDDKSKPSSWIKGVFTNSNEWYIKFLQTSWDGENSRKYQLDYSKDNEEKLKKFLQVPFEYGWTELDYRLGEDGFYKSCAVVTIGEITKQWQVTLITETEQAIPFVGDRLSQKLRVMSADSSKNNYRRYIDKTEVKPICFKKKGCRAHQTRIQAC